MTGTTLLEVRCRRRGHVILKVVTASGGGLAIEAARYSTRLVKDPGTPARFALTTGSGHRYGCACGTSSLIRDDWLAEAVAKAWFVC